MNGDCHQAGLRVANNGGSENELQALFGWVTNTQSLVYTRGADKKRLALAAAMKLMGAGA
jgi:hypothetical protein